jgi:hypothetical protein
MAKREKTKDNHDATKKRDCGQVEQQQQEPDLSHGSLLEDNKTSRSNQQHLDSTTPSNEDDVVLQPRASKRCSTERSVRHSLSTQLRISSPTPPTKVSVTTVGSESANTTMSSPDAVNSNQEEPSATTTFVKNGNEDGRSLPPKTQDLESALHRVAGIGKEQKDCFSTDEWVTFRVGDAGDASVIASWYRKSRETMESPIKRDNTNAVASTPTPGSPPGSAMAGEGAHSSPNEKKYAATPTFAPADEAPLELWLTDGLGDEDTPPSVHSLLAYVSSSSSSADEETAASSPTLGAIALLTMAWDDNEGVLRVEWLHVDPTAPHAKALERKLWFRLSCIALITSCQKLVVDKACSVGYDYQVES